ncbi:hypothetical protein HK405_003245, partial [Cladochytrium tenue]
AEEHRSRAPSVASLASSAAPSVAESAKTGRLAGDEAAAAIAAGSVGGQKSGATGRWHLRRNAEGGNAAVLGEAVLGIASDTSRMVAGKHSSVVVLMAPAPTHNRRFPVELPHHNAEIALVTIQTGVILDEFWPPVKKVEHRAPVVLNSDYISVQMHSKAGSVWKRYWCILRDDFLEVYHSEYKDSRPPVALFDVADCITAVTHADPELVCVPHCLSLAVGSTVDAVPEDAGDRGVNEEVAAAWLASVIDADTACVYVTADSRTQMETWEAALRAAAFRHL